MISSSKIARAVAVVSLGAMLAIGGCSSKPKPVEGGNPNGGASQIGENGTGAGGGTSLEDWEKGTVGKGGPLSDIHFGYNDSTINEQDGSVLRSNADWLQKHPQTRVQVEGYCDERGSEEYNIALGAKRAQAGKDYLETLGISPSRMSTISYGKELPLCQDHDETCWQQNRRDHFNVSKSQ